MPTTVATSTQTYWKDCWAPSSQVNLTLRSNGEEPVQVFTTQYTLVPAGMPTPTVAAILTDGGSSGGLPAGNYVYLYVYASTAYPSVEADTTAGGNLWPKGQPSPVSLVYNNTANHKINVAVGTSQRADIDKILIYRNNDPTITDLTYAQIVAQAGQVFYVGFIQNDPTQDFVVFTDAVQFLQEEMEVDNFAAPLFWKCVYIDQYWYGVGAPDLAVPVTIDASGNLLATVNAFFSGRNGQLVTFDGIQKGGFDGRGTFYYLYNTITSAYVSVSSDLSSQDFPGYVGTTTMRVRGAAGTLFRSKARNPFAWGYTQYQTAGDSQVRVTQQFAQELGGYGVACAVMPVNRQLKLDFERPARCYAIDVSVPLESNFEQATRLLDSRYIVTAHDSQFPCLVNATGTALRGFDTSNFAIVQSDSNDQAPISDDVFRTLRTAVTANNAGRQFHGVFDPQTELSAFWFKQSQDPNNLLTIDSCLLYHGPSGQWSFLRDLDVTMSMSVYDPVLLQEITIVGTGAGGIYQAFTTSATTPNLYANGNGNFGVSPGGTLQLTVQTVPNYTTFTITRSGSATSGEYFDISIGPNLIDRVWFNIAGAGGAPASPSAFGRLIEVDSTSGGLPVSGQIVIALTKAGYTNVTSVGGVYTATSPFGGNLSYDFSASAHFTITSSYTPTVPDLQNNQIVVSGQLGNGLSSGLWMMLFNTDGTNEYWARISAGPAGFPPIISTDIWFDPNTKTTSPYAGTKPQVGQQVRVGLINCEAQTYFQPSDTVSGQRVEMWSTRLYPPIGIGIIHPPEEAAENAANQSARLYAEFDSTLYGSPFPLVQTKRGDNTTLSDNWTTSNKVPTSLMTAFGIRLIERGYGDFEMLSFTLFGK